MLTHVYKKITDRQLILEDFNCPLGMHLDASNRWIQKANLIPWNAIEDRYAHLFPGIKGVVAKPLRTAFGAPLIQKILGCSDRELVEQIKENPYLQYFIGLPGYASKAPFALSLLVEFRKRLIAEVLGETNELIIHRANRNHQHRQHHRHRQQRTRKQTNRAAGRQLTTER